MARNDQMVSNVDNRDQAPATQPADLSTVETHSDDHWQEQAQDREASSGPAESSRAGSDRAEPAPESTPQQAPPQQTEAPAPAESSTSSSQQTFGDSSAEADQGVEGDVGVGVDMAWRDLDGDSHTRDVNVGVDYDSQTMLGAAGRQQGETFKDGADTSRGETAGALDSLDLLDTTNVDLNGVLSPVDDLLDDVESLGGSLETVASVPAGLLSGLFDAQGGDGVLSGLSDGADAIDLEGLDLPVEDLGLDLGADEGLLGGALGGGEDDGGLLSL